MRSLSVTGPIKGREPFTVSHRKPSARFPSLSGVDLICHVENTSGSIGANRRHCVRRRWSGMDTAVGNVDALDAWEGDHVIPLWRNGSNGLDNMQTLCVTCHIRKTRTEAMQRYGHPERVAVRNLFNGFLDGL